jgi:oxygen-independent coproporphyrinogen-3 oxidase
MCNDVALPSPAQLRRFDAPGPRYTSYPTADRFVEAYDAVAHTSALGARTAASGPLSLYVHLPFCDTVCYYCACNKVVTRNHTRTARYLDALECEADLISGRMSGSRSVGQLHLGGGTPTFLAGDELRRLVAMLAQRFDPDAHMEFSVEIDPRSTPAEKILTLAELGCNRISVGVQDFDADVQRAVNRLQGFELTQATLEAARTAGIRSINLDLIYGLPRQTRASFAQTLDKVLVLSPERIALYHYAHLPERFKPQRRIDTTELPSAAEKMRIMLDAISRLSAAGYRYIGMDHFAKASDELAQAQMQGRLHRNFQGYSTRPDADLIGLGVSAISKVGPTYAQNARDLDTYYGLLADGELPTARGLLLEADDIVRRAVIMAIMCHFEVSKEAIAEANLIDFDRYFARDLVQLRAFIDEGLVEETREWISVTPRGKLLVRAVAMCFDRYLRQDASARRFSRIV